MGFLITCRQFLNTHFYLYIILGSLLFSLRAKKRPCALLRFLFGLAICAVLDIAFDGVAPLLIRITGNKVISGLFLEMTRAFLLFAASAFAIYLTFEYMPTNALYTAVLGYTLQHLAMLLSFLLEYYCIPHRDPGAAALVYLLLHAVLYTTLFFAVRKQQEDPVNINNKNMITQSLIFLFCAVILSVLGYAYIVSNEALAGTPAVFVVSSFGIMMCVNILLGLLDSFRIHRMEKELRRTRDLWKENIRQYELSRETVDLLNFRYHDLKDRMSLVIHDEQAAKEIEGALSDYDASIHTGNQAMDVVLTEKSLLCRQHGITFLCMADGNCLRQMGPVDVYSILGNLIENAIEYLRTVEDKEKRLLIFNARREGNLDLIQVENYLENQPEERNGLPLTTKENKDEHGFGLRSVQYTLDKYEGILHISTSGQMFSVTAAIPE